MARNSRSWSPTPRTLRYLEELADKVARSSALIEDALQAMYPAGVERPVVVLRDGKRVVDFAGIAGFAKRARTEFGRMAEAAEDGVNPITGEVLAPTTAAPAASHNPGGAQ